MLHGDTWVMIAGVVLSVGVVGLLVWYVNSIIPQTLGQREWLTRFVALVLTVFLGVFVADVMVSWDVQLARVICAAFERRGGRCSCSGRRNRNAGAPRESNTADAPW